MGGGGHQSSNNKSRGSSNSVSHSETKESQLSQMQASILAQRNQQYNDIFFPEIKQAIANADPNSGAAQAQMQQQAGRINQAFGATDRQINQNLAQQGMLGDQSGVQAAMKAASTRARTSALANAYANTMAQSNQNQLGALKVAGAFMPTPTQSAQFHHVSDSKTENKNFSHGHSGGWNMSILS